MLIITGLGRCGTSLVAKWFQMMGYNLGNGVAWHDSINAGLELGSVYQLNIEMYDVFIARGKEIDLKQVCVRRYWKGKTFEEAINSVDKDEKQGGYVPVVKDPRFTWHPKLIEAWAKCRQDLKLLILHRDVHRIMNSRLALAEESYDPKPGRMKDINMFKVDFCDFLTEVMLLDLPYELLLYPRFCLKPFRLFNAVTRLYEGQGPTQKDMQLCWDRIFDPSKLRSEEIGYEKEES